MSYKPHVTKLQGSGQCTFVYMSAEDAEELEKVLLNYQKNKSALPEEFDGNVAIGIHLNPETKRWDLAIVKYNALTNSAKIDTVKEVGVMKPTAVRAFKKEAMKLKIV